MKEDMELELALKKQQQQPPVPPVPPPAVAASSYGGRRNPVSSGPDAASSLYENELRRIKKAMLMDAIFGGGN